MAKPKTVKHINDSQDMTKYIFIKSKHQSVYIYYSKHQSVHIHYSQDQSMDWNCRLLLLPIIPTHYNDFPLTQVGGLFPMISELLSEYIIHTYSI